MKTLRTVFAVIPAAAGVECVLKTYKALPLADRSKLIGLHVSPLADTYGLAADIALAGLIEAQVQAAENEKESAEAAFLGACEGAGIAHDWRAKTALSYLISADAGSMARAADLIIFPRLPEAASLGRHRLEDLVLAAGRPVLTVPADWLGRVLGETVLIAWDGGREAARAAFDALPLLINARMVRIVSVQGFLDEPVRQFTLGDDIAATLSRHGVRAESHTLQSSRGSVKEELKVQMLDTGADMIVMGCYGHSRVREMVLGGVSREMLKDATVPLLLAN